MGCNLWWRRERAQTVLLLAVIEGVATVLFVKHFETSSFVPCAFFPGMSDASSDVTAAWNVMWKYCISSRTIR